MTQETFAWDDARTLMAEILECTPADIPEDARINRFVGWDSLAQANMMIAVEQVSGRQIAPGDAVRLISTKAIARYLAAASGPAPAGGDTELSSEALGRAVGQGLEDVGIHAGDVVLVHSLVAPALAVADAPDIVLQAMLRVLTTDGTLVMPGFTNAFVEGGPYDRQSTPSQMGILTECLRQLAHVKVSPHPYHRFLAVGASADDLTASHGPSSFGEDSPLARMHAMNGKILFLSVDWESCVFLHYVEERHKVAYRAYKEFAGEISAGGRAAMETWTMYVRDLAGGTTNDFVRFGRQVEAAGLTRQATRGPFVFKAVDMAGLFHVASQGLQDDPLCLVTRAA